MTSARRPIRVTLVNDYEIIVQGLRRMLEPFSDRIEIVETQVGGVPDLPTDIALFDTFAGRRYALQRVRLMAHVDTEAFSGSKRAACVQTSTNTSCVTSSDIAGSRSTRETAANTIGATAS